MLIAKSLLYHPPRDENTYYPSSILNDKVPPFFEGSGLPILSIMANHEAQYCGKIEKYDYQLYLGINDIEQTKN